MENKDLDNFFKERAPQFNEQPGDALWAKIESGLDAPAPKQGGKDGLSLGKWLLGIGGVLGIIILAVLLFPTESSVKVKLPVTETQQEIITETAQMPADTVKPKNTTVAAPKAKKPVPFHVPAAVANPKPESDTVSNVLAADTPQPINPVKTEPKKIKVSVQESKKRAVLTVREKISQEKFDSIVRASLIQYKDKAGMQLIVKGFNGMMYRDNIPQKGEVSSQQDTIKTQPNNKLAVTTKLITTTNGIANESVEFTPKYDSVTDTYFVPYGKRGAPQQDPVYTAQLTVQPEFPGGNTEFLRLVTSKFRIPKAAKPATVRVHVSFVIETNGDISNIKVLKDPGYGLGAEAVRVLQTLTTKWKPGEVNGGTVRTAYILPLTVSIK